MPDLRPVGSEFEFCFPPSPSSTDPSFTIWRYRISGYSDVDDGAGGVRQAETLVPVSSRKFRPDRYVYFLGQYRPVPPPECAALLDDGWKALASL